MYRVARTVRTLGQFLDLQVQQLSALNNGGSYGQVHMKNEERLGMLQRFEPVWIMTAGDHVSRTCESHSQSQGYCVSRKQLRRRYPAARPGYVSELAEFDTCHKSLFELYRESSVLKKVVRLKEESSKI